MSTGEASAGSAEVVVTRRRVALAEPGSARSGPAAIAPPRGARSGGDLRAPRQGHLRPPSAPFPKPDAALVAEADDELVDPVGRAHLHDVPEDRLAADLDHRLRPHLRLLAEASALAAGENHGLHGTSGRRRRTRPALVPRHVLDCPDGQRPALRHARARAYPRADSPENGGQAMLPQIRGEHSLRGHDHGGRGLADRAGPNDGRGGGSPRSAAAIATAERRSGGQRKRTSSSARCRMAPLARPCYIASRGAGTPDVPWSD